MPYGYVAVFQKNSMNWANLYTRKLMEAMPVRLAILLAIRLYTQRTKSQPVLLIMDDYAQT
jgi:hypothetical protein